jgi:ABC-2 type transport system ATP-binding protein
MDVIPNDYWTMEGISKLEAAQNHIQFLFKGNINLIMQKLAALNLLNLWIEEPDLEEIFMHYYEKEDVLA